jgi:hypothetical protein
MRSGSFNVALEELDFLAPLHPDEEGVFWCRAVLYLLDGRDPGLAVADLDRAVEIEPRFPFFYAARAFAYFKQREYVHSLGDVARAWATRRFCELKLTHGIDFRHRQLYIGYELDVPDELKDNRGNDTNSLGRELVDIGLGCLVGFKPPRLN